MTGDHPDSGRADRRSPLVRLAAALTARGSGIRRGPLRLVATWLGRHPDRAALATPCRQCGEWAGVNVVRLGRSRARYWCRQCGAVVVEDQLAGLSPRRALRTAAETPAAGTAGAADDPRLVPLMPAAMRHWLRSWPDRPGPADRLDKARIYRLYREWDAHRRQSGTGPAPGLPPFSTVVGVLDDACHHLTLAVRWLLEQQAGSEPEPESTPPPAYSDAVRERVGNAHHWRATYAPEQSWIHSRVPATGLATPAPEEVAAARDLLRSGEPLPAGPAQAAREALFGVVGGPPFRQLVAVYPAEQLLAGLDAYLASGARPLRADVVGRLTSDPAAADPRGGWAR